MQVRIKRRKPLYRLELKILLLCIFVVAVLLTAAISTHLVIRLTNEQNGNGNEENKESKITKNLQIRTSTAINSKQASILAVPSSSVRPDASIARNEKKGQRNETTALLSKAANASIQQQQQQQNMKKPDISIATTKNGVEENPPKWFRDYAKWHHEQRTILVNSTLSLSPSLLSSKNHKFLILRCFREDRACGGFSDRIKPLPLLLLLAHQTKRLFFISWTRPCALEEFLLPPLPPPPSTFEEEKIVLDWRVPDLLHSKITPSLPYFRTADEIFGAVKNDQLQYVSLKLQDQHGGANYYDQLLQDQRAHRKHYRSIFFSLFRPSPALQAAYLAERQRFPPGYNSGDGDGSYAGAHLRAFYTPFPWSEAVIQRYARNAVICASQLRPGVPIYFASDSKLAIDAVKEFNNRKQQQQPPLQVITMDRPREALHLDKASSTNPLDYFDVFLDLLHYSNGACISHGQGGFGRLGVLLSHNSSCLMAFIREGHYFECPRR